MKVCRKARPLKKQQEQDQKGPTQTQSNEVRL